METRELPELQEMQTLFAERIKTWHKQRGQHGLQSGYLGAHSPFDPDRPAQLPA